MSIFETSSSSSTPVNSEVKKSVRQNHESHWNSTLDHLQIQSQFKDIVVLEGASHAWNRMLMGLPVGQLSFLLRAGAYCLPTPMNLCHWKYIVSNSCSLYSSPNATTAQILNGCPEALNQGRCAWRHNSVKQSCLSCPFPVNKDLCRPSRKTCQ